MVFFRQVQISAYLDNVFDVAALLEDSMTKTLFIEKVRTCTPFHGFIVLFTEPDPTMCLELLLSVVLGRFN